MIPLNPEQEAVVKQIQDNLETALKNLHNAIKSSSLAPNEAFRNAMSRLDEYSFWMGQCGIQLPELEAPAEEVEPATESNDEPMVTGRVAPTE